MGVSTDAILFWGFAFKDGEYESPEDADNDYPFDEWEEKYAALKGIHPPKEEFSQDARVKELYSTYWDEKNEFMKNTSVEIDMHCCGEYPIPFIAIKASKITAYRGDVREVKSLDVNPEWEQQLRTFCEEMKIPWKEPGWRLVSWWG